MKKSSLVLVCATLLLLTGCSGFRVPVGNPGVGPAPNKAAVPDQIKEKVVYRCYFTSEPIRVDGFLNEPAWEKAPMVKLSLGKNPEGIYPEPISKTEGRVLHDNTYLYVAFKAYDKDIWSYFTERDAITCWEDVLEVFLKTDPVTRPSDEPDPYYDFEINSLGTVMDAFVAKRDAARNYARWSNWNCSGLKVATQAKGTLNNWRDVDEYWTLEVAIPFAELPTLNGEHPKKGDVWLFNLARYDYSVYLPKGEELSSYALLSRVYFHLYEDWVKLVFE